MNYEFEIEVIIFLEESIVKRSFISSVFAKNYCEGRYKAVEEIKEYLEKNEEYAGAIKLDKIYYKVMWVI